MSFIEKNEGRVFAPGWFLATDKCVRETAQIKQAGATDEYGRKYVPMGTVVPSNDGSAKGILYEDVDVTSGDMPGSIVTQGIVYEDRLPVAVDEGAKTALTGITFIETSPDVTRE